MRGAASKAQSDNGVSGSIWKHQIASLAVLAALVGGVGGWLVTAAISGAVVSPGVFVVSSHVKKVQHASGGVVGDILVREGDRVNVGDVVKRLDRTTIKANMEIVSRRLDETRAKYARLEAERDDMDEIVFPRTLTDRAGETEIAAIVHGETRLFAIRREALKGRKAQLRERIIQYEHEIEGLKAQEAAYTKGLDVLNGEIAALDGLRFQGIVSNERLNGLKTQAATFEGERGERVAMQAQAAGKITETRLQIIQADQDMKSEVASELREAQAQIAEYVERRVAAEDELKRTDVVAPASGIVHAMTVHTVGGVVTPADPVMSIVPEGDLSLEVRIQPKDVDHVQIGQSATIRMSAFNQRTTPELKGEVTMVAADQLADERTGQSYYTVKIGIAKDELSKLGPRRSSRQATAPP